MKALKCLLAIALIAAFAGVANADLIITGAMDGPRTGGLPKAVELYATSDIPDLAIYAVKIASNGANFGTTFALTGSASAGDYIWIASEAPGFTAYFGWAPTFTSGVANVNGNDVFGLFLNDVLVDVSGNYTDCTGSSDQTNPWGYMDSYIYRLDGTGASTTWIDTDWDVPGNDWNDSQGSTGVNGSDGKWTPFGTYAVPEPTTLAFLALGGLALIRRRR